MTLEKRFAQARVNLSAWLDELRGITRAHRTYSSCLENPYSSEIIDGVESLEAAFLAFGPLMREAIEAGHHGRWIQHRLPDELCFRRDYNHGYGAVVMGNLGVCCDVHFVPTGISDCDRCVICGRTNGR